MVSEINNIKQSSFQPEFSKRQAPVNNEFEPLNSFADEDQAIISAQANMLNELEKFNAGEGDALDLVLASEMAKITVEAQVNVINAKTDMMDEILKLGE